VGEPTLIAMLTPTRLSKTAHLHLEEAVRGAQLGLVMREAA